MECWVQGNRFCAFSTNSWAIQPVVVYFYCSDKPAVHHSTKSYSICSMICGTITPLLPIARIKCPRFGGLYNAILPYISVSVKPLRCISPPKSRPFAAKRSYGGWFCHVSADAATHFVWYAQNGPVRILRKCCWLWRKCLFWRKVLTMPCRSYIMIIGRVHRKR